MNIVIIGAGMAGLLAGNVLRRHEPTICEKQEKLPNNHHALLRFRTAAVGSQCGIPFRRVKVFKSVSKSRGAVADALAYSLKATGQVQMRSIINTEPSERWIAPPDLIEQMAVGLSIQYNAGFSTVAHTGRRSLISTVPMQSLMDVLEYSGRRPVFQSRDGCVYMTVLPNCDVYATVYFPYDDAMAYRASITGNVLQVEYACTPSRAMIALQQNDMDRVLDAFGIQSVGWDLSAGVPGIMSQQKYAKIANLSDEDRQLAEEFMYWATVNHGVYSLGRFATWRAGLLMDDLVNDLMKIEAWMGSSSYRHRKEN